MRFLVGFLAVLLAVSSGCGTDAPERVSANTDASALLRSTVQNLPELKSASVDLKVSARDGSARVTGPFAAGDNARELPRFALAATITSGTRTKTAGATWTGERGYATLDGTAYEVPSLYVRQLTAGFEQAAPLLGVDVSKWVTAPRNEGTADVAGVETIKVSGAANVPQVAADVRKLVASLPLGAALPPLSAGAVKNARVDVYTGAADQQLRRLVVSATADGHPVVVDLTLSKVGADVSIDAPKNARPFSELTGKLGALRLIR